MDAGGCCGVPAMDLAVMTEYSFDPKLDAYIRANLKLYQRALRRVMARNPDYQPKFLLGMAAQTCLLKLFRKRKNKNVDA